MPVATLKRNPYMTICEECSTRGEDARICLVCRNEIEPERLVVLPNTPVCSRCAKAGIP
jgi:RNA polymerase-binding transcription factor DksA